MASSSLRSTNNTNDANTISSNNRSGSPPQSITAAASNGPQDFNSELNKHLTLKRQKQQINATEANLRTNRGPPPQPPAAPPKNITTVSVLKKN